MKHMGDMNGNGSVLGTVGVVFLYVLSVMTLQGWAALATIFAGATAGGFTIYKWIHFYKKNKRS